MKGLCFASGMVMAVVLAMWLELKDREEDMAERAAKPLAEALAPFGPDRVRHGTYRGSASSSQYSGAVWAQP